MVVLRNHNMPEGCSTWAWMKTGERGEAWQERRREWEALVTLLIISASSTGPLLPLLSNFLLPPMPPRSYRKLWFEMLPIAPAEISFAVQCREWRWRASTSLRLPGWRMARWSPWRSSRARWSSWRTPPLCEGRPPGTSCRWMNCARRWDAAIFDFIPLSLSPVSWKSGSARLSLQSVWRSRELWKRRDLECAWACSPWQGLRASCHHLPKGKCFNLGTTVNIDLIGGCEWERGKPNLHLSEEQPTQPFRLKGGHWPGWSYWTQSQWMLTIEMTSKPHWFLENCISLKFSGKSSGKSKVHQLGSC